MLTRPARPPTAPVVSIRSVLTGVLATLTIALLGERSWRLRRSVDTIERRTMRIQTALIGQGLHLDDATGEIPPRLLPADNVQAFELGRRSERNIRALP